MNGEEKRKTDATQFYVSKYKNQTISNKTTIAFERASQKRVQSQKSTVWKSQKLHDSIFKCFQVNLPSIKNFSERTGDLETHYLIIPQKFH